MKNLEFLSNFAENFRVLSSHGQINPSKFEQNWAKIVDFSLMAYFLSSLNWGEQVCKTSKIVRVNSCTTHFINATIKKLIFTALDIKCFIHFEF